MACFSSKKHVNKFFSIYSVKRKGKFVIFAHFRAVRRKINGRDSFKPIPNGRKNGASGDSHATTYVSIEFLVDVEATDNGDVQFDKFFIVW